MPQRDQYLTPGLLCCAADSWTYEYDAAGNATRFDRWDADTETVARNQVDNVLRDYSDNFAGSATRPSWEYTGGQPVWESSAPDIRMQVGSGPTYNSIGFAPGTGNQALVGMRDGGGHAMRHLIDAGIISNRGSLSYRQGLFEQLAVPILEHPTHTFDWRVGATQARGFASQVDGQWIVVLVAKDGPYQGTVISAIIPDSNQMKLMGLIN